MAEIRCVCGAVLPAVSDTGFVRCPKCDAQHAVPTGRQNRTLLLLVCVAAAAAVSFAVYRIASNKATPPVAPPQEGPKSLYEEARERMQKGDIDGAIVRLEKAVAKDPKAYDARWALAEAYRMFGCHERALPHLRQVHEWTPEDPKVGLALGESLLAVGDRANAVAVLEEVRKRQPSDRASLALGDAYSDLDRLEEADRVYRTVTGSPSAAIRVVRTLLLLGKLPEAEEFAKQSIAGFAAEDREGALARMEAQILREKGEPEKAIARIDAGIAAGKFRLELMQIKAQFLLEMGRTDDSLQVADEVMRYSRAPERKAFFADVGLLFVEAMLLKGERAEAKVAAEKVLEYLNAFAKYGVPTSFRETTEPLLQVTGRGSRDEYLKYIDTLPRRAHNDHYLFLAILSRADKKEDDFRKFLSRARERTIGKNYPSFLIDSLGK